MGVAGVRFLVDGVDVGHGGHHQPLLADLGIGTVPNGAHTISAIARDAAGNTTTAGAVAVTTSNAASTRPRRGVLVQRGSGTSFADSSGTGNAGTLFQATWAAGKYGTALSFDGVNDYATVPDSASLDLTTSMTMEAWVRPTASTGWRTVLLKETVGDLAYSLYSASGTNRPSAFVGNSSSLGTAAIPLNTWSHVAADLRRRAAEALRQRRTGQGHGLRRCRTGLDRCAEARRQRDLERVLHRPDRRGAAVQQGANRRRDPGRHERSDLTCALSWPAVTAGLLILIGAPALAHTGSYDMKYVDGSNMILLTFNTHQPVSGLDIEHNIRLYDLVGAPIIYDEVKVELHTRQGSSGGVDGLESSLRQERTLPMLETNESKLRYTYPASGGYRMTTVFFAQGREISRGEFAIDIGQGSAGPSRWSGVWSLAGAFLLGVAVAWVVGRRRRGRPAVVMSSTGPEAGPASVPLMSRAGASAIPPSNADAPAGYPETSWTPQGLP